MTRPAEAPVFSEDKIKLILGPECEQLNQQTRGRLALQLSLAFLFKSDLLWRGNGHSGRCTTDDHRSKGNNPLRDDINITRRPISLPMMTTIIFPTSVPPLDLPYWTAELGGAFILQAKGTSLSIVQF